MTHKHAELIAKFAEVAKITDQPHKQFQYLSRKHGGWRTFKKGNPKWNPNVAYRFKRETVVVNGVEVPRPLKYSEVGSGTFYLVDPVGFGDPAYEIRVDFCLKEHIKRWTERGLVHSTEANAKEYAAALGWN